MKLQKIIKTNNVPQWKEVIERLIDVNLNHKISSYLNKYKGKDVLLEIKVDQTKTERFKGTLKINADGQNFYYSREDYKNLDDLVNHLFLHFKEELSAK